MSVSNLRTTRTLDRRFLRGFPILALPVCFLVVAALRRDDAASPRQHEMPRHAVKTLLVSHALTHDVSRPLKSASDAGLKNIAQPSGRSSPATSRRLEAGVGQAVEIEQTSQGTKPPPERVVSFDGLGAGFVGPQGTAIFRNPSDNSLAVGPNHIVQIVNSRMAIFTKRGAKFDTTGRVLYGPVPTNNVFKGFGDADTINNGDAVVRYDQLADRWLVVMPIFRRLPPRKNEPFIPKSGEPAHLSPPAVANQPGPARLLEQPPPRTAAEDSAARAAFLQMRERFRRQARRRPPQSDTGSYAMCYAISTGPDPLGSYYRYEFVRPLFPDYPRPAIWPDGYYVPTSTGDNVIQKHAYVVDRARMLAGEDAAEQGIIIDGVNFLN
ncbi:MAG TPA: hypothetical protein VMM37_10160, partial [Bacteroidota bacterium]|nr:hypothetical protein [Bacteroidota bacterium]